MFEDSDLAEIASKQAVQAPAYSGYWCNGYYGD
jgi:hypothetical protein